MSGIRDRTGRPVRVGNKVRVLEIDPSLLSSLRGEELSLVQSMLGEVLPVVEVTDAGYAIVEKEKRLRDGSIMSQSISLAPSEMERHDGP